MKYIVLISLLVTIIILLGTVIVIIRSQFNKITQELKKIMSQQEEFDKKIEAANAALDAIGVAIKKEAQQIADFIAANPAVDTSALDGVVGRLETVAGTVEGIFEPASESFGNTIRPTRP